MGAAFSCRVLEGTFQEAKTRFVEMQEQDKYENGHSYSGGIGMLVGVKNTCLTLNDRKSASQYIMEHAEKWESALAVQFHEQDKILWLIGGWCAE